MNAVVLAILVLVVLSLCRVPVVLALIIASGVGGVSAGLPFNEILRVFNDGLGNGAPVALAYAALGAFAVALSRTGMIQGLISRLLLRSEQQSAQANRKVIVSGLFVSLVLAGFASQTIVPVHIAFIPILVPPLLRILNRLKIDRRAIACAITFSITITYMTTPVGFGAIYLNDILMFNVNEAGRPTGFEISRSMLR